MTDVRVLDLLDVDFPLGFATAVQRAVDRGLAAAAILDSKGWPRAVAGALDNDEARALAAAITHYSRGTDPLDRMLAGELVTLSLEDREVALGIAARCVFVLVVFGRDRVISRIAADDLRREIDRMLEAERRTDVPPPAPGSGGSSSGPAELPVIELGVTVPRRDRN